MNTEREKYIEEQKKNHIEKVKKYFFAHVGYSSEVINNLQGEGVFFIDLDKINGVHEFFKYLKCYFPLDPELSEENIFRKNWDALSDSIGGGMILSAERENVIYIVNGFEKFSNQYPEAWDFLSI